MPLSKQFITIGLTVLSMVITFQNCGDPNGPNGKGDSTMASVTSPTPEDELENLPFGSKTQCQLISPNALADRMKSILEIPEGDVPVLDQMGIPTPKLRLQTSRTVLGEGDPMKGRPDDFTCTTPKFKAAFEIMIDACAVAMASPMVKTKLFPAGFEDLDPIYLYFIGRPPTEYETKELRKLAKLIDPARAEAAVCSAVAISFESLIKI